MRIFCLACLFFSVLLTKAQTPTHWPETAYPEDHDSTLIIDFRHVFYTQTGLPFYTWDVQPKDFEFYLFDRWGEILVHTKDPNFNIDQLLKKNIPQDTYIAKLIFTDLKGEKHELILHYDYLGFYCSG